MNIPLSTGRTQLLPFTLLDALATAYAVGTAYYLFPSEYMWRSYIQLASNSTDNGKARTPAEKVNLSVLCSVEESNT